MGYVHFADESYKIIGVCMDVHNTLGSGFREVVYQDALEYEFRKKEFPYQREKPFRIPFKDIILPRTFIADFLLYDEIILEIKATRCIISEFIDQTRNYLRASNKHLGIIANFGESSFHFHRVVY